MIGGDISDGDSVRAWISEYQPTHVIHLGALQSPDCDADPHRGLEVNVGGTLNLLNASAGSCERFVLASSGAVYGRRALYDAPTIKERDLIAPPNFYGVWKVASEHLARLFHERTGIATVCLRLNTVYGYGRDFGKTAAPTNAMKAIALGSVRGEKIAFRMPYYGRENYHYVEDVGAHFAAAALDPFTGYGAFNIRGRSTDVADFLALVKIVAGEMGLSESVDLAFAEDATEAFFACDLDSAAMEAAFHGLPLRPFQEGIRLTLDAYRKLALSGQLTLP